jgi:hypothetical protein
MHALLGSPSNAGLRALSWPADSLSDERLFRLEAAGDNILCVLEREGVALLELERRLEEFIFSDLDFVG